jgi:hypothetical protein
MKKLFFGLVFISASLSAQVNHNGDFQLWSHTQFDKKIKEPFGVRFSTAFRWGDNASRLFYEYYQPQITFTKNKVVIAPGYRQLFQNTTGKWIAYYMPMIDLFLSFPLSWEIEDRNRVFYQIPGHGSSVWIYRNRIRIYSPIFCKIKLFAEEEAFFQEGSGFNENRLGGGIFAAFTKVINAHFFYTYHNLKQKSWTYQNLLRFELSFNF